MRRSTLLTIVVAAAAAVAASLGVQLYERADTPVEVETPGARGIAALVWHEAPRDLPVLGVDLAPWRGAPVILNLWATWCAPCIKELPGLARLDERLQGRARVVTFSLDRRGIAHARSVLNGIGAGALPLLHVRGLDPLNALGETGLPVTLFLDAEGREVARLAGAADWTGAAAHASAERLISQAGAVRAAE